MVISLWALLNESCLKQTFVYQPAAKASMPSVRMHKWKWLLFIYLADDMLRVSVGGSIITSFAFNFDGLTRSCVKLICIIIFIPRQTPSQRISSRIS